MNDLPWSKMIEKQRQHRNRKEKERKVRCCSRYVNSSTHGTLGCSEKRSVSAKSTRKGWPSSHGKVSSGALPDWNLHRPVTSHDLYESQPCISCGQSCLVCIRAHELQLAFVSRGFALRRCGWFSARQRCVEIHRAKREEEEKAAAAKVKTL